MFKTPTRSPYQPPRSMAQKRASIVPTATQPTVPTAPSSRYPQRTRKAPAHYGYHTPMCMSTVCVGEGTMLRTMMRRACATWRVALIRPMRCSNRPSILHTVGAHSENQMAAVRTQPAKHREPDPNSNRSRKASRKLQRRRVVFSIHPVITRSTRGC